MRILLPGADGVALDVPGAVFLDAREALLSDASRLAVGLAVLATGLPLTAAASARLWAHERSCVAMAGEALDLLAVIWPWKACQVLAEAACSAILHPEHPGPATEKPAAPASDLKDPYMGRTLDTGHGPETWLQFAGRQGQKDLGALALWKEQAQRWERGEG